MSKYVPARANGDKPYVVTVDSAWNRPRTSIGWGPNATEAKWDGAGRKSPHEYVTVCRRATPQDFIDLGVPLPTPENVDSPLD